MGSPAMCMLQTHMGHETCKCTFVVKGYFWFDDLIAMSNAYPHDESATDNCALIILSHREGPPQ